MISFVETHYDRGVSNSGYESAANALCSDLSLSAACLQSTTGWPVRQRAFQPCSSRAPLAKAGADSLLLARFYFVWVVNRH